MGGGREVGKSLALTHPPWIRTLEITTREQDRNTVGAHSPSSIRGVGGQRLGIDLCEPTTPQTGIHSWVYSGSSEA